MIDRGESVSCRFGCRVSHPGPEWQTMVSRCTTTGAESHTGPRNGPSPRLTFVHERFQQVLSLSKRHGRVDVLLLCAFGGVLDRDRVAHVRGRHNLVHHEPEEDELLRGELGRDLGGCVRDGVGLRGMARIGQLEVFLQGWGWGVLLTTATNGPPPSWSIKVLISNPNKLSPGSSSVMKVWKSTGSFTAQHRVPRQPISLGPARDLPTAHTVHPRPAHSPPHTLQHSL